MVNFKDTYCVVFDGWTASKDKDSVSKIFSTCNASSVQEAVHKTAATIATTILNGLGVEVDYEVFLDEENNSVDIEFSSLDIGVMSQTFYTYNVAIVQKIHPDGCAVFMIENTL